MKIREACSEDVETLFEIRTSVSQNYMSREELATLGITPASVVEMLQTDYKAWVAEIEGQAIGFSMIYIPENTIFAMFISPDFQGRGAGRLLMKEAEEWFWRQGVKEIWLLTANEPNFRSYGFYLHLGWMPTEVQTDGQIKFIKKAPEMEKTF